jgi:hypothetical protein
MSKFITTFSLATLAILAPVKAVAIFICFLVFVDLVLGLLASKKSGIPITSAVLRRTVTKLLVYETTMIIAFLTQKYMTGTTIPVSSIVSAFIGVTELTSVVENLNTIAGTNLLSALITKLGSENDTTGT